MSSRNWLQTLIAEARARQGSNGSKVESLPAGMIQLRRGPSTNSSGSGSSRPGSANRSNEGTATVSNRAGRRCIRSVRLSHVDAAACAEFRIRQSLRSPQARTARSKLVLKQRNLRIAVLTPADERESHRRGVLSARAGSLPQWRAGSSSRACPDRATSSPFSILQDLELSAGHATGAGGTDREFAHVN